MCVCVCVGGGGGGACCLFRSLSGAPKKAGRSDRVWGLGVGGVRAAKTAAKTAAAMQ